MRLVLWFGVWCSITVRCLVARCESADLAERAISPADIRPLPSAAQEPSADQRRLRTSTAISLHSAPWELPAAHPLRLVRLVSGDSFAVEVMSSTVRGLDVRWLGQVRFRIPVAAIDRIVNLPGERDLMNEHFAHGSVGRPGEVGTSRTANGMLALSADSGRYFLELPIFEGHFRFATRFRAPQSTAQNSITWTVRFSEHERLRIRREPDGFWRVIDPFPGALQRQSVPEKPGWHTLRLQRAAGRLFLSLDDASLYAGTSPAAILSGCEIESSGQTVVVDQTTLVAQSQPVVELPPKYSSDAVVGTGGEIWWGEVRSLGPDEVIWEDASQAWRRSWKELHGIVFGETSAAVVGRELRGNIVSLRLQPLSDRPDLPGDRLTASLGTCRNGFVELHHPLLGRLMVPLRAIQRIEHRRTGRSQMLDARDLSLGKPVDVLRAPPLEGQLVLDRIPSDGVDFVAEFSGLEPSGPDTPPGSRSLKSLQNGRLVTELFVNDRLVGNFNHLTGDWSLPGEFDRLRLKIPAEHLQSGRNSWRIVQQPGDGPRRHYDECRVRNIGWEMP